MVETVNVTAYVARTDRSRFYCTICWPRVSSTLCKKNGDILLNSFGDLDHLSLKVMCQGQIFLFKTFFIMNPISHKEFHKDKLDSYFCIMSLNIVNEEEDKRSK